MTTDLVRGAVECNMGGGTPVGPRAWQEWNVNELTDVANHDEISGFPVYKALLCNVVKLEEATATTRRSAGKQTSACGPIAIRPEKPRPRNNTRIYLDNNATTRVSDAVRDEMTPFLDTTHGNPSSIHGAGRAAREALETARRRVAKLINARPRRVIFSGSGSEADNQALKGVALAHSGPRHIVTTTIEHPAILKTAAYLERAGCSVTYLDVGPDGVVSPDTLRRALREDTILVSIMMANNEVGTIQPIKELCAVAHERGVAFHTDAVQAVGKIKIDVEDLDIDMLSLSAHKFHGPKGVGALYVRKGLKLEPLVHGGKQEGGLRAGTENVAAIVGMGKAAEIARGRLAETAATRRLRDELEEKICALIPEARLNGDRERRLSNTLNLTLPNLRGESLVVALDQHGISLSSGSACKAGSPDPTHVLMAMGKTAEEAHCSVRFSLSHDTSPEEIEQTAAALDQVLVEMETTVRFLPCK